MVGSFLTLFVGKFCVTKTETVCKNTMVFFKLSLKKEFREIGLRAGNNLVVKAFDQA